MFPDPAKIVSNIDRLISQHEEELVELQDSLPNNRLAWSAEQEKSVYEQKLVIGYLREHGKTNALLDYTDTILTELYPLKVKECEEKLSNNRRNISRLKTSQEKYRQVVDMAREIIRDNPKVYRGSGKYALLARRVCKKLGWSDTKIRSGRRDLRAAEIIPDAD